MHVGEGKRKITQGEKLTGVFLLTAQDYRGQPEGSVSFQCTCPKQQQLYLPPDPNAIVFVPFP